MKALLMTLGLLTLPLASQAADGFFKQLTPLRPGSDRQRRARRTGLHRQLRRAPLLRRQPQFPLDQFIDGKVLPRDGSIKEQAAGSQRRQAARAHRRGRVPAAAAT